MTRKELAERFRQWAAEEQNWLDEVAPKLRRYRDKPLWIASSERRRDDYAIAAAYLDPPAEMRERQADAFVHYLVEVNGGAIDGDVKAALAVADEVLP